MRKGRGFLLLLELFTYLGEKTRYILLVNIILGAVTGFGELKAITSFSPVISSLNKLDSQNNQGTEEIVIFLVTIFLVTILRLISTWTRAYGTAVIVNRINTTCYRSICEIDYQDKSKLSISRITSLLVGHIEATSGTVNAFLQIAISSFSVFGILIALFLYEFNGSFISLISVFAIYTLLFLFSYKPLLRLSKKIADSIDLQAQLAKEVKSGSRIIEIDNLKEYYCKRNAENDLHYRRSVAYHQLIGSLPKNIIEGMAIIIIISIAMVFTESNKVQLIGVIALSGQRLLPLVQQIFSGWICIEGSVFSLEKVIYMIKKGHLLKPTSKSKIKVLNSIGLRSCSFSYDGSNKVLDDFNLNINKGEKILIRGDSGSGKTTTMDLLLGLLKPGEGQLILNGEAVGKYESLPFDRISYAPQNVFIRPGTITQNIAIGEKIVDFSKLKKSIQLSSVNRFINEDQIRKDLVTISDDGESLSGGQRQRIGIARAIYKNPDFLFLDECTSAMDKDLERKIFEALMKNLDSMAIIVISHSKHIDDLFDRIIDMEEYNNLKI
mgnify:CR=1 FL=1|tara:strand:+ start:60740 stop:62395 length:1656 start_codon:yes stop_codon:yes gene_type:complete